MILKLITSVLFNASIYTIAYNNNKKIFPFPPKFNLVIAINFLFKSLLIFVYLEGKESARERERERKNERFTLHMYQL